MGTTNGKGDDYLLIGLTGSIGAGKSSVARFFEDAGIPVLSADSIAKELMAGDPGMRSDIIDAFGPDAYNGDTLDRKWLAGQVFGDREKLDRLNDIVHPRTIAEQGVRARALIDHGAAIVVCEAALIYETGGESRFDYIIVVDADQDLRYRRAAERDGVSVEEVRKRDAMQMPAKEKVAAADFMIENNGTEEELKRKTAMILGIIRMLPSRTTLEEWDDGMEEEEDA